LTLDFRIFPTNRRIPMKSKEINDEDQYSIL